MIANSGGDRNISLAVTDNGSGVLTLTTGTQDVSNAEYETVAASQTAQVLGSTGAIGDYLGRLVITPAAVAVGVVTLLDGVISIPILAAGTLPTIAPFFIDIGAKSVSGAWKVTTGLSVSVIGIGNFT